MNKNAGFILFSVLIILQILLLFGWYSLQDSLLLLKSSHKIYQQQALFSAVKLNLHKLEKPLQTNIPSACVVPLTSFIAIEKILTKTLAAKGCQIKIGEINFKYLIQILGQNPCHIIKNNATIAQYLRLTLFATSRQTKDAVIFLQSIIARPIVSTEICHATALKILPGRQSWRQV